MSGITEQRRTSRLDRLYALIPFFRRRAAADNALSSCTDAIDVGADRPRLVVSGAMLTDVGSVRAVNEDTVAFVVPTEDGGPDAVLALVADGMGGHAAGEIASALAAETIRRVVYSSPKTDRDTLKVAFDAANRAILDYGDAHPEAHGMGTTCTAILVDGDRLSLAHIGDSRAYLLRNGEFEQLSDDHTLHAQLVRDAVMTAAEAAVSPGGNVILQALGARSDIKPTLVHGRPLREGAVLLLCSDGLYNMVTESEIVGMLRANEPEDACRLLIAAANAAGGLDNISIGVFHMCDATRRQRVDQAATKRIHARTAGDADAADLRE